jgi:hypothetical protein
VVDGDFSSWDDTYHLALADEHTEDRAWSGTYHLVAIYSRALTADEVMQNFSVGEAYTPEPQHQTSASE